ncbi:MAG: DUF962 domain-containing protein [Alphaproteobacteria bacterium]|nr:DUF962 domain-containing protein [Alphaproteobacteria bacterium]MBL6938367.1 DUF962 domain-containing protein [Alphaproteobacteria bacterium]MBL7096426.1 DUF962 domain-containing protein [Alphaproteobacteria bacterium]
MAETTGTNRPIESYADFWLYYLQEHAKPATRRLHFLGTGLALATLSAAIVSGRAWLGGAALLAGYGPAWVAHFFIEKNRPATFTYPFWSLISDFRMAFTWLTGHLDEELAKAGVHR